METEVVAKHIRPFWGRVAVIESPVDQDELDSGIVLPHAYDGGSDIRRGVVQYVDQILGVGNPWGEHVIEMLLPGTVVHFENGDEIRDGRGDVVVILNPRDILAYEVDA